MSKHLQSSRITVPEIRARKGKERIACLTAYTTPIAQLLDPEVDVLLVGDTVGMVLHGMPTTVGVTLEMMILHGQAVMRGAIRALVVVDMPFGSYEGSREHAYISAARIMRETGCQAVKLETGAHIAPTVRFLAERGIPVMGHVGLLPQSVHADGGFKAKGRSAAERERILGDARAVAEAGAFAVVLEGIAPDLADEITASVQIPTIGIGASRNCDGQVLVIDDMLGLFDWTPKFARRYANLREQIAAAAAAFARDVRSGDFPGKAETYEFKSGSP